MTIEVKQLTIKSSVDSNGQSSETKIKTSGHCRADDLKDDILKEVERLVRQVLRETADR